MNFLWSMRNRKKYQTLAYGLFSGAFLALQPKAWQKSLVLLMIMKSRLKTTQAFILKTPQLHAHQTTRTIHTLRKSCVEGGSKFTSPGLSKSLGRDLGIF